MKNTFLLTTLFLCFIINTGQAQENSLTLSGGYSFTNIEDEDENSSGWRINMLYELTSVSGNVSNGLSFGYIRTKATIPAGIGGDREYNAGHWPIYYAPKYTFLQPEATFRPFLKGALGIQFSKYEKILPGGTVTSKDSGFYGGLGAGFNIRFSNVVFTNLEYEWVYLGNSWYKDGFVNSAMLGLGINF